MVDKILRIIFNLQITVFSRLYSKTVGTILEYTEGRKLTSTEDSGMVILRGMENGTYAIEIYCNAPDQNLYYSYFSGIISIYANSTNRAYEENIALFESGHAPGQNTLIAKVFFYDSSHDGQSYITLRSTIDFTKEESIRIRLRKII